MTGVAVIGIDHRHAYGMLGGMLDAGAHGIGWWTDGSPKTLDGFTKRFPDLPRHADRHTLLNDPNVHMVLISAVPGDRADLAIEAMQAGKDVMVDKPGCISQEQLDRIIQAQKETGRIWSVDFSEHFEVPAVAKAAELISDGQIGKVVQTVGLGPHRLNAPLRDPWFFEKSRYGGILTDIGSHQIDQFLFFTGSDTAEIAHAEIANHNNPDRPNFDDFGEIVLRSPKGHGYIRLDWYTPDALPNWGDGRLTILGTEGYIELRKYVDVAGREGTDHLFLVNKTRCEYIDCKDVPITYFQALMTDIRDRSETAMKQSHAFEVTRLALLAQQKASG